MISGDAVSVETVRGVRVLVDRVPAAPSVAASLVVHAGVADESATPYGALPLGWTWRDRGVNGSSRAERDAFLGRQGVTVQSSYARDHLRLDLLAPAPDRPRGVRTIVDALVAEGCAGDHDRRTFPAAVRRLASVHALEADDEASRFATWRDEATLDGPWGRHPAGDVRVLDDIGPEELFARYCDLVTSVPWTVVVSGAVDAGAVFEGVDAALAGAASTRRPALSLPRRGSTMPLTPPRIVRAVDDAWLDVPGESGRDQDPVHLGWRWAIEPGPDADLGARSTAAWLARSHVGRLVATVRETHGLAYDVAADATGVRGRRWVDVWIVTSARNVTRVREVVDHELARAVDGPTMEECATVNAHLRFVLARDAMRSSARCQALVSDLVMNEPPSSWSQRLCAVEGWTCDAFAAAVRGSPPTAASRLGLGAAGLRPSARP